MAIQTDQYILAQSISQKIGNGEEIRADLKLKENKLIDSIIIFGNIKNEKGEPLSHAIIKVTDQNHDGLNHEYTDEKGNYSITAPPGKKSYDVYATAHGYLLDEKSGLVIQPRQTIQVDFALTVDENVTQSYVSGHVTDKNGKALKDVIVNLFLAGTSQTIGMVLTNEYGQYVFNNLKIGKYEIRTELIGYKSAVITFEVSKEGQIISGDLIMEIDAESSKGTVNGIILDEAGNPIKDSLVVLYQVIGGNLIPVQTTYTNDEGFYLFVNVNPGEYLVKATKKNMVELPS